jgi:hypothetical protein
MLGRVLSGVFQSLFHRRPAPPDPAAALELVRSAQSAAATGNAGLAIELAERAIERDPTCHDARLVLAGIYLQGREYDQVIADIHAHLKPRTYMEIGVAAGKSLRLARPGTRALGVDPDPDIQYPLSPDTRVFRETSDQFFASHDVRAELGGLPLELAFIDGLHWFDNALRDFINLERHSAPGATILVHDCFPIDRVSAQRERRSGFWSGDVWRLVVLLKKHRPDLRIHTIATPPTGLAVIRGLDPSSQLLSGRAERLIEEYLGLDYGYLDGDRAGKLNAIPNDWDAIRRVLDAGA